jgi:hypothetical protein
MQKSGGAPSCDIRTAPPAAETAPPKPVDFVCEADVVAARKENRSIPIGPRTIITPAARDVPGASDILVMV